MDNKPWDPEGWDASERSYKLVVSGDTSSEEEEEEEEDVPAPRTHPQLLKYKKLVQKEAYVPEE